MTHPAVYTVAVFCNNLPNSISLKAERCDEDVDEDCEEDGDGSYVVYAGQPGVLPDVV